ncbi:MAG: 2Fe-2S iron-sulfur cluster-binding protein [Coriobacteriia bacterium]|nr:2Fe-2S iron-sulfur cluster-binding protein [Coriobacteriia bacterium]
MVASAEDFGLSTKCFTLQSPDGTPLVPFRAGSFIPVHLEMGGTEVAYPYALSSSPHEATMGTYRIIVKRGTGGYASSLMLDTWKPGDHVTVGAPFEDDAYSRLDDGDRLVAIAGSVGVVPFHSMAKAIAEGDADFRLTLFYVADTRDELLYRDEWAQLMERSEGRFKLVPVVAGDEDGCERAPITLETIERHASTEDAVFLVRGPAILVASMRMVLAPLKLSRRRLRSAFSGDAESRPAGLRDAVHHVAIRMGGTTQTIPAREDETVLAALEKAGLQPLADCRAGICGFCHTTLLSGEFILATDEASERRMHDRSSFFHPCCSYPVSDMAIVIRRTQA